MGADFMLAICELPQDPELYRDIISYRVKHLDDKKIEDFASNWWHILELRCVHEVQDELVDQKLIESELYKLDNIEALRLRKIVTLMLHDLLDEYVYEKEDYRRDVGEIHLKGTWYMATGGMSWGDLPTDAYETVCMLEDSGVLDGLGLDGLKPDDVALKC